MGEKTRLTRIRRTARLISQLQKGIPYTAVAAAKLLGVEKAAAERQLRAIELELSDVKSQRENGRRVWRSVHKDQRRALKESQLISTCLGASLAPLFDGCTYATEMHAARARVGASAQREGRFADAARKFWFVQRGGEIGLHETQGALLDDVIEGLLAAEELCVTYCHFDGSKEQLVLQPLSLAIYDHQLYLVARKSGDHALHPYRFARLEAVESNGVTFTYPTTAEYDPNVAFAESFGIYLDARNPAVDVVLKLDKRWTTYVQRHRWHKSQQVRCGVADVEVRLHVRVCNEVKTWIRGFGNEAVVVKPSSLRDEIRATSIVGTAFEPREEGSRRAAAARRRSVPRANSRHSRGGSHR